MAGNETGTARTRGARGWAVDGGLTLCAVAYGLLALALLLDDPASTRSGLVVEGVLAAAGCGCLWLRRRWPVGLAVALLPLSIYGFAVDGALLVALFTVAIHRPPRTTLVLGATSVLGPTAWNLALAWRDTQVGWIVAFTAVGTAGVVGWGLFVRHRRQLILSLRERASRAEAEAALRAEQAQHQAREQLAREMHDVLGHRLSLLSVHAGALEYRRTATEGEVAEAAGVIRATAHQALQDLREVIGILRAPAGDLPQPEFAGITELVAEARRAGADVELRVDVAGSMPESIGRTAYRIVQEGLTNARKHAPGSEVSVIVTGEGTTGLSIEVASSAPSDGADLASSPPGSAQGLVGLAERATLVGGRLTHGRNAAGGFVLTSWLPWPS